MTRAIVLCLALLQMPVLALAADTASHDALALAALVAANSPTLAANDKSAMAAMFDGRRDVSYPAGKTISIKADSIKCSVSNVDITLNSCQLVFGGKTVSLTGRHAHEIFATLEEVGIPNDGAMGTIYESLTNLSCTVDPGAIKQAAGEGAACTFDAEGT